MNHQRTYYVGSASQVATHAAPLQSKMDISILEADEVERVAQPGDLAIFFSEHFDPARKLIPALRAKNVGTLYLVDGILEWRNAWENRENEPAFPWTMRPALADKIGCIGPSQARILSSWGNTDKVEMAGLPRMDRLTEKFRSLDHSNPENDTDDGQSEFRLLIMTAKWPGFTEEQIQNVRQGLLDLKEFLATKPKINGRVIRPIWRLTGDLEKSLGVKNELTELSGKQLNAILAEVDGVVTTPSTAMLEGMLHRLPVAILEYNNCPQYVPSVWQIRARGHIESVLHQLADPLPQKMQYQEFLLRDTLQTSFSATDRVVELIEKMHLEMKQSLDAKKPITFSSRLLPAVEDRAIDFVHHEYYPNQWTSLEIEHDQLRLELADQTHRLKICQSDLEQAQKELSEAHKILFSIEKHPIVGPIVKIRRKFLDFLASWRRPKINRIKMQD